MRRFRAAALVGSGRAGSEPVWSPRANDCMKREFVDLLDLWKEFGFDYFEDSLVYNISFEGLAYDLGSFIARAGFCSLWRWEEIATWFWFFVG